MIEQPISSAVAALIYAILGYWKEARLKQGAEFQPKRTLVTIVLSSVVGIILTVYGVSTGNYVIDGAIAVGIGSFIKKGFYIVFNKQKGVR